MENKEIKAGSTCLHCGIGKMHYRSSKFGPFLGCSEYPKCANTAKYPKTKKAELEEEATKFLEKNGKS